MEIICANTDCKYFYHDHCKYKGQFFEVDYTGLCCQVREKNRSPESIKTTIDSIKKGKGDKNVYKNGN